MQSVISRILGQRPESLKKGTFKCSFTQKYLKMTLFLEKRALFCQILYKVAPDYWMLISFGLFLDIILIP